MSKKLFNNVNNDEIVNKIFDDSKNCTSISSYAFVDIINYLKPIFLYSNDNMPTPKYECFIKYLLSNIELYSSEQLKIIERFCLRMDEDALTGIMKCYNISCKDKKSSSRSSNSRSRSRSSNSRSKIENDYLSSNDLYCLLKKYKTDDAFISEIIKKDHINISNSLVNILAKNILINKQICKYNGTCYRKNNEHLKTYFHN